VGRDSIGLWRPAVLGTLIAAFALAATFASAQSVPATKAVKPRHIMSMNMCNDLILLMLVPRERIASVTYLAHDAVAALMPGRDRSIAINHGTAEEIVVQKPDLILASPWSTPTTRRLAKMVGAPIVEVEAANDFEAIRRVVRQIGAAVDETSRAEALIREMDNELNSLSARRRTKPLRVVVWTGDGSVPGRGTLTDAIITAAGGVNIAAKRMDDRYSSFGLEELLIARPDAIMQGVGLYAGPALRDNMARHPLIGRLFAGRQIDYPDAGYTCGLPQSALAARQLADAFVKIPRAGVRW
jgi:iron complex transport system substrate-binding protein